MARDKNKLKRDLEKAFNGASKKAFKASFETKTNKEDNIDQLSEKMASQFARIYADEISPKLAIILDEYLDSQVFDVSKLVAGGNPVSGILKSI